MGYSILLLASIAIYASAGAIVALGQSRTSSFFVVGAISFAGGAYASAILVENGVSEILVLFFVSAVVGGILGALTSVLTSFHDKRVIDIVGIALLLVVGGIVRAWYDPAQPAGSIWSLTNGTFGFSTADNFSLAFVELPRSRVDGLMVATLSVAASMALVWRLSNGSFGKALKAINQNRLQAALDGIRITRQQVLFGVLVGSTISIAGSAYFATYRFVDPSIWSIEIAIGVCLIPMVFPYGPIWIRAALGATAFVMLPEVLRSLSVGTPYETYIRNILFLTIAIVANLSSHRVSTGSDRASVRGHFL